MQSAHAIRTLLFIALLVALGPVATDMYLPALPTIAEAFDTNSAKVQLTLSVYFIGFALGQLIYGPLSDRFGRKPVLQIGMALFVVSSALAVFAASIEALITIRLLQALGGCAGPVLGRAIVRDMYPPAESGGMMSHISSAMALAPALAPILGSYLTILYGWEANFWFLMMYGVIALGVISFGLPETLPHKNLAALQIKQLFKNYCTVMAHSVWRLHTLICSFIFAGLFSFLSGSSFVLIAYLGVSKQQYALLFAVIVVGFIVGSQLSARLLKRHSTLALISAGCTLGAIAGVTMLILSMLGWHTVFNIIVPHFFFMMAVGIVMPLTLVSALAPFPHMAGVASALFGAIQMLIASLHGVLVGHFYTGTPTAMAAGIAIAGLVSFTLMTRLQKTQHSN